MRRIIITLLFAVAAGACERANTTASASAAASADNGLATDASAPANADRKGDSVREVTLPAGTHLPIVLDTTVGSDISKIEQPVHAHLAHAVAVQGKTVLPEGTRLSGVVTDAQRSGKVKGRAHVAVRFDTLVPAGQDDRYRIDTTAVGRTAPSTKKKDALEIGGGAAGGALIGGLIGGGKGALIGTAAGGGAGTAVVLSTRGQEIHLPRGATMTLKLVKPVTVRVRG
jgi:hypothetical protein